jgi:undecaprenyl pyrophosphate phosphatase UppP
MVVYHQMIAGIIMQAGQAAAMVQYFFRYRIPRIQTWIYLFSMPRRELGALELSIQIILQILRHICLYLFRDAIETVITKVFVILQLMKVG